MEIEKYQSLLNEVNTIVSEYDKQAKATGERFNIFQILGMESKENKTHSAFLYALLNPKGEHLQGTLFLELFLKKINCEGLINLDSAFIIVERHIGIVDCNYETGGRIDLVIEDKHGNAILIENKIYALDQPNQLQRYHTFGAKYHNQNDRKFKLVYLTLDGAKPKGCTIGKLEKEAIDKITCLSYKKDIICWLEECKTKVENVTVLREAINQYQYLLKILTLNKETNTKKMENDIKDIITRSEENFKSVQQLINTYQQLKEEIFNLLVEDIKEENEKRKLKHTYNENIFVQFSGLIQNNYDFDVTIEIVDKDEKPINIISPEHNEALQVLYNAYPEFGRIENKATKLVFQFYNLSPDEIFKLKDKDYRKNKVESIFEDSKKYWSVYEKQ